MNTMPILAIGGELIPLIFFIIWVVQAVVSKLKEAAEEDAAKEGSKRGRTGNARERLDRLAEERRRQIQEARDQRRRQTKADRTRSTERQRNKSQSRTSKPRPVPPITPTDILVEDNDASSSTRSFEKPTYVEPKASTAKSKPKSARTTQPTASNRDDIVTRLRDPNSLRQAIILKEILDSPVSQRDAFTSRR